MLMPPPLHCRAEIDFLIFLLRLGWPYAHALAVMLRLIRYDRDAILIWRYALLAPHMPRRARHAYVVYLLLTLAASYRSACELATTTTNQNNDKNTGYQTNDMPIRPAAPVPRRQRASAPRAILRARACCFDSAATREFRGCRRCVAARHASRCRAHRQLLTAARLIIPDNIVGFAATL